METREGAQTVQLGMKPRQEVSHLAAGSHTAEREL